MKQIFVDLETTGISNRCGVIQIAGIIDIDGETKEEFDIKCGLFKDDLIEEKSFEKTGMSIEKISKLPNPTTAYKSLISILSKYVDKYDKKDKLIAIGYFADFDNQFLRSWFKKNGDEFFGSFFFHPWIDVAQLVAYTYQQDRDLFPNFQLPTVAYMMELADKIQDEQYHDGLYDIRMTRKIYYKIHEMLSGK